MSLLINGATIIDGVSRAPIEGKSIWVEHGRIKGIGAPDELGAPPADQVVDARGKYVIPGLMNANVHLLCDIRLEILARYEGRYDELIAEAAQVALKNGLTTVFDTWGPRRFLIIVRDRISAGTLQGSRIFCAGNIIGFDGPYSQDNFERIMEVAGGVSPTLAKRINAIWVENTGRHLMWMTPEQVAQEVRTYIGKGIDFIKYASNEHFGTSAGAFVAFSEQTQTAIVGEAHFAGISAQAHTMSVEGLRIAVEAGCDLIQHANITGPVPIPETTLKLLADRGVATVVFPWTQRGFEWLMRNVKRDLERAMWKASDINARNLIRSGGMLLMANDGAIFAPEMAADPEIGTSWGGAPIEDSLLSLAQGHFVWFKAMEEKGCPPMEMLKAATRNIALAYGKEKDLGTLEPGKIADILILDKNPLQAAENYRRIHTIVKEGVIVDRNALPTNPILTKSPEPPAPEEDHYIPFLGGGRKFPGCGCC
jgi:imidazolonepropionase-like amidohydrolase